MTGIAVVFNRNGEPAAADSITRMTHKIAHRGPDGIHHWRNGAVALGHCAMHTTPEDVGSEQPCHDPAGELVITFNGRIDNRDELTASLGLPVTAPDANFALAAYGKWGEESPVYLLGDFAYAIWDERNQRLFCARDIMGVQTFVYFASDQVFLAGSEKAQLFTDPRVTHTPNKIMVAALLANRLATQTETIHRDVKRLPPAHSLTITAAGMKQRRYWDIADVKPVRHRTDSEYADHFRDLLAKSIECRWRNINKSAILLSGGLDSTILATIATKLYHEGKIKGPIESYSQVFPDWPTCDESEYIQDTAASLSLVSHLFPTTHRPVGAYEEDVERYQDLPDFANDSMYVDLRTTAKANGVSVLLTGLGGDDWFTGSPFRYAHWLRQGRLAHFWKQLREDARRFNIPTQRLLWQNAIRPLAPQFIVDVRRRIRSPDQVVPDWMLSGLGEKRELARAFLFPDIRRASGPLLTNMLEDHWRGDATLTLECNDRVNARYHMEMRHPLHDRRVVEFGLGIPEDQRFRGGVSKFVLRNNTHIRMPNLVRTRTDKPIFSEMVVSEIRRQLGRDFFNRLEISERKWVDLERTQGLYASACQSFERDIHAGPWHWRNIWFIYAVETLARKNLL